MRHRWIFTVVIILWASGLSFVANAANIYWNGAGVGLSWSTAGNWSTGTVPTRSDVAIFNSTSTKNAVINSNVSVAKIHIQPGYTGTIRHSSGASITVGSGGYVQSGGTFTGGTGALFTFSIFTLTGGTFTAPSGPVGITGNFYHSGGTFTDTNGPMALVGSGQSITAASDSFNSLTLNDGLIGYWPFDTSLGSKARDLSGLSGTGSYEYAGPQQTSDVPTVHFADSGSLFFTKEQDTVNEEAVRVVGQASDKFRFPAHQDYSVAFWMRTNSGSYYHQIIGNMSANNRVGWNLTMNGVAAGALDGRMYFGNYTSCCPGVNGTTYVKDNNWHHITGVRRGSVGYLYVDGVQEGTPQTAADKDYTSAQDVYIGRDPNGYFPYRGNVDDVRIYNRALSQYEISKLAAGYNLPVTTTVKTLGSAITTVGSITNIGGTLDVSSSNYNLTTGGNYTDPLGGINTRNNTLTFNGTGNQSIITLTGSSLGGLTMNKASGTLSVGTPSLSLANSLLLTAGIFTAPTGILSVAGDWTTKPAATFSHNNGTVNMNGTTQTVSGSTTFSAFRKVPSAASSLTFSSRDTFTFSNLVLIGPSSSALLTLNSTITGVQTFFNSPNAFTQFLAVKDNSNQNTNLIYCYDCTDNGNTFHWEFASTPSGGGGSSGGGGGSSGGGGGGGGSRSVTYIPFSPTATSSTSKTRTVKDILKDIADVTLKIRAKSTTRKEAIILRKQLRKLRIELRKARRK